MSWIAAAYVTLGVLRIIGNAASFETTFSVLVFAGIPCIFSWSCIILNGLNYVWDKVWRCLVMAAPIWSSCLLWTGLTIACNLNSWQAVLAALPMLIPLWVISFWLAFKELPETYQSFIPWRKARGKRVTVYYCGNKNKMELDEFVRGADDMLGKVERSLGLRPLKFNVKVFLCNDEQHHRKLMRDPKSTVPPPVGQAHHDSVSLEYGTWSSIGAIVSHEFCHVVRRHRIAPKLLGLLDEGLATYVMEKLNPGYYIPAITIVPCLQIVANETVFNEWTYTPNPAIDPHTCYKHAHAFADYLISQFGMPRFIDLCREVGNSKEVPEGARLAAGIEKTYSVPLPQLEKRWRKEWPGTWSTGQTKLDL